MPKLHEKWWLFHPIIAPLPHGFMPEDKSHQHAYNWMRRATVRIEKLEAALLVIEGMLSERLPSAEKCEMAYEYVRGIEYDQTR